MDGDVGEDKRIRKVVRLLPLFQASANLGTICRVDDLPDLRVEGLVAIGILPLIEFSIAIAVFVDKGAGSPG